MCVAISNKIFKKITQFYQCTIIMSCYNDNEIGLFWQQIHTIIIKRKKLFWNQIEYMDHCDVMDIILKQTIAHDNQGNKLRKSYIQ